MQAAITGATGLLGSNLAIQLLAQGHTVRCTYRGQSPPGHLREFAIDWVRADLSDPASLQQAFAGCDVVFHCAALISFLRKPTPETIKTNVEGTRNVSAAVRTCGVQRLVHCSSVVTCAISTDGKPVDETRPWNFADFGVDEAYSITKRQAEELVVAEVGQGLDAVIVNPCYMLGPYDPKPSSGRMIIEVIQGKIPGSPTGMNNFVDVRDVARGMIAAWQKGKTGERYILGNENLSYRDLFHLVARVAGAKPPRLTLPQGLAMVAGFLGDVMQRLTGREAMINTVTVRYSFLSGYIFSSEKARRELGYQPGPVEPAIRDAIAWFRSRGML